MQRIFSGSPFEENIGYARAVADEHYVFVSGTTGYNYSTMQISESVVDQAEQACANIRRALEEAGSRVEEVVRVRYIFPNGADFEPCWPVFRQFFGNTPPAATMIIAGLLDPNMKLEIEVTAQRSSAAQ